MTTRIIWTQKQLSPQLANFLLPADLSAIPRLVAELFLLRGFELNHLRGFLDPEIYPPTPPQALPDLEIAVQRLLTAIDRRERLLIWGDFDVDGLTASALLAEALQGLGLELKVHIPRYHGIAPNELKNILADYPATLVISCDVGSSSASSIDYAKSKRVDFIILDHHHLPPQAPAALATVNPTRLPEDHPFHSLPACGVAFLLVQHLYAQLNSATEAEPLLEFVALGIVADVAEQIGDTRQLLQRGLFQLKSSVRLGLTTLAAVLHIDLAHITADDIAYRLAPALNAFGRLADANDAYSLLTTRNSGEAHILAIRASTLNQQRRFLTRQIVAAAEEQLKNDPSLLNWTALVLENPNWEAGVIGAAANELAAEHACPVVLFTVDEKGNARGSARSTTGYDMTAALAQIEDLLINFGGHAGAAGVTLNRDHLPVFRRRFSNALDAQEPDQSNGELLYDLPLEFDRISLSLAQEIERLAPFGNGNPRPIFVAHNLQRRRTARIGRGEQHRRLLLRDDKGVEQTVLWWNSSHLPMPEGTFDLAYQLAPVYRDGNYELQITLVDWLQTQPPEPQAEPPELFDCRIDFDLDQIRTLEPDLMIWAEGYSANQSPGVPLSELDSATALLIYSTPAHPELLEKATDKTKPKRIYFYAKNPPFDTPQTLCEAVSALLRAALEQYEGQVKISQIAERTAHTMSTVQLALEALGESAAYHWINRSTLQVERADRPPRISSPALERALEETAAYRRFFQRAELENLLP